MRGRAVLWLTGAVVAAGTVVPVPLGLSAAPKTQSVTAVNMHIDPGNGQTAYTLRPDDDSRPNYVDYRVIPGGDECVVGEFYPVGLALMLLNRRGDVEGTRCSDTPGNEPRGFRVHFTDAGVCQLLMNQPAPCDFLTPAGAPTVRGETVFKSKTGYSDMTFYFITEDAAGNKLDNYRLTPDQPARMVVNLPNTKAVSYTGPATLAQHQGNPGGYVPLVSGIPLSFRITFDRVTVQAP